MPSLPDNDTITAFIAKLKEEGKAARSLACGDLCLQAADLITQLHNETIARLNVLDAAVRVMKAMITPVFTPEQVRNLHHYQFGPLHPFGPTHPFTCPNRGDGKHFDNGSDLGALIPTTRGWICQCCDYTQNWAHDFMKKSDKPPSSK